VRFDHSIAGAGRVPPEPLGRSGGTHEERRTTPSTRLAEGTLACPSCDAPVAPLQRPMSPADLLGCGFCRHQGAIRDFLSLAVPTRPTRVTVHVRASRRAPARVPSR